MKRKMIKKWINLFLSILIIKTSLKINEHQDESNFEIPFKLIDFITDSPLKRGVVQQVCQFFNVILMVDF